MNFLLGYFIPILKERITVNSVVPFKIFYFSSGYRLREVASSHIILQ